MLEKAMDQRGEIKIIDIEALVPGNHLLRKIDRAVEFDRIYDMVAHLYSEDNGRPSADPVVLVKMALIQHLYGIRSMRRTVEEISMNVAYRWFLHFNLDTPVPHFATVSYAFATRFPSEVFEEIFAWILEAAVHKGFVKAETVFIDATHIKANANKKKKHRIQAKKTARVYDAQLRAEIDADRAAHGKKPLKDQDDDNPGGGVREITQSTTDPESGVFHKGEHEIQFAYTAHVACDENNFVLACEVAPGNVHDSVMFDPVYEAVAERFDEDLDTVTVDSAYRTPWICKKVQEDGRNLSAPYKAPQTKKGFFKKYEYVYDEHYDCYLCPHDQILHYATTNRDGYREYKSNPRVCINCPSLSKCTHSKNHQKTVQRHMWEDHVEQAEDFRHTPRGKESYSRRKETIERVFGDAKEKHGMRYTLHRGLARVTNWVRFKFAAMNLKKLAMWAW